MSRLETLDMDYVSCDIIDREARRLPGTPGSARVVMR